MFQCQTSSKFQKSSLITSSWGSLTFRQRVPQLLLIFNGNFTILPASMESCSRYQSPSRAKTAGQFLCPSLDSLFFTSRPGSAPVKQTSSTQTLTSVLNVPWTSAAPASTIQLAMNVRWATIRRARWLAKNVIWLTAKLAWRWGWRKFVHAGFRSQSSISRALAATSSRLFFLLTQSSPSPLCSRR